MFELLTKIEEKAKFEEKAWIYASLTIFVLFEMMFIFISVWSVDYGLLLHANTTALASITLGGLFGFLFGVPRSLSTTENVDESKDKSTPKDRSTNRGAYRANTNLEQISDWLTKILVGVGLTQLNSFPIVIDQLGKFLSTGVESKYFTTSTAATISISMSVIGFISVYLWTRIHLGGQFAQADFEMLGKQLERKFESISEANSKEITNELEKQNSRDALALNIVERWLTLEQTYGYSENEVRDAIILASPPVQTQIFLKARSFRIENDSKLKNNKDKERNNTVYNRVYPIFTALIKGGPKEFLHEYHGQIGYTLKDKPNATDAEIDEAISQLTTAILERQKSGRTGHETYEFVRAVCRIIRDPNFKDEKISDAHLRDEIISDLKVAVRAFPDFSDNPQILKWLEVNNIKEFK